MPQPRASRKPSPSAEADESQTQSPNGGSSPGSSAAADPFVADAGAFTQQPEGDEAPDLAAPEPLPELVPWTAERIRRLLELQGTLTHALVGVGEQDWLWLPAELDAVCGALADFANRVPALAAMAHLSDEAAIVAGFTSYALRSYRERLRVLRDRAQEPAVPVTGRAPADDEPDPETVEWSVQP